MTKKNSATVKPCIASAYNKNRHLYRSVFSLLIAGLQFISTSVQAQIPDIRQNLINLNQLNLNEQVYLHTDCEVYAPGDTIWFKAYIRNTYSLQKSRLSNIFHLLLVNNSGDIISMDKYLITNSQSAGYIVLNNKQEDGHYSLYGYSSWNKNFDPEDVYKKRILIIKDINKGKRIIPHFNKTSFQPGDTIRVMVKYYDDLNNQLEGSRFRYRLTTGKDLIGRGAAFSETTETSPLEFVIPDSITEMPVLHLWDNNSHSATYDIPTNIDIHIDFFPEGGNCLANEMGIVAFKATYSNGAPADIKGLIVDQSGEEISYIKTEHEGMGKFIFQAREGMQHFLKITSPASITKMYKLPEGKKNVWSMSVNPFQENIHIQIKNSLPEFDTCLFVLSMRGFSDYFRWIRKESEATFMIPSKEFPSGIAVLTLLDKFKMPLAERLVFLNHERPVVNGISTDGKKYLCRDSVILDIDLSHADSIFQKGQYSLTVYDQEFGSSRLIDEPDIICTSYLKPEIRGRINNPNYYFKSDNRETRYHLDLLLLTQGWRTYRYEKFLHRIDSSDLPVNQELINGNIKRFRFGREPQPTEADINLYFGGNWIDLHTDESGNFSILPEYDISNISPVIFTARDKQGSDKVIIEMEEDSFYEQLKEYLAESPDSMYSGTDAHSYIFEDIKRTLDINKSRSIWIEEVEITRNIKPDSIDVEEEMIKSLYNVKSARNEVISTSNDLYQILLATGINARENLEDDLLEVYFQGNYETARFIVDGFDMGETFSNINSMYLPSIIENVHIARGFDAFQIYRNHVVIYIKTFDGTGYNAINESIIKNYIYIPILKVNKEFYSPSYRTEAERNYPVPDIRKTIYWNPDIQLDETGKARVVFFNSDRYTRVRCILEGISNSGMPIHEEASYDITIYRE